MPKSVAMSAPDYILAVHISLRETDPPIWRRVLVPYDIPLQNLHQVVQVAMGWHDQHLFEFHIGRDRYGTRHDDFQDQAHPVRSVRQLLLKDVVGPRTKCFTYVYDMGDYWLHDIVVEEILSNDIGEPVLQCVAGARHCPPEDIGGAPGYEEFLSAIGDPAHEDHDYFADVYGDGFDPEAFDLDSVNGALAPIKKRLVQAQKRRSRRRSEGE